MHILDVSIVYRYSKCTKIVDLTGGAYRAPQTPWLGLRGPTFKVPTFKEKGGEGREGAKMIYARAPETLAPPVVNTF